MPGLLAVLLAPAAVGLVLSGPTDKLRLPHYDWNACPFECCTYRSWTAVSDTPVLRERKSSSKTSFMVKSGESVVALTGVVVTTKAGKMRIHEPLTVGEEGNWVHLSSGDEILMLHYEGEGWGLFWFAGRLFPADLWHEEVGFPEGTTALEVLELPKSVWWVKVKNAKGQIGWTTRTEDYTGADACG